MTVEEGSILDCKDSGAINTYRSNADEPQAPCTFSAMARLGDQTSGRPAAIYLSRFGKLDGVAGQGCCWRNSSATLCDKSTVRASFNAHIEVRSLESMNVEIGLELMILQCLCLEEDNVQ